jgi:hypothetical protein
LQNSQVIFDSIVTYKKQKAKSKTWRIGMSRPALLVTPTKTMAVHPKLPHHRNGIIIPS